MHRGQLSRQWTKKFAVDKILTTIVNRLEQAVEKNQKKGNPETDSKSEDTDAYLQNSVLKGVDLTLSLTPEEYKKKKKICKSGWRNFTIRCIYSVCL